MNPSRHRLIARAATALLAAGLTAALGVGAAQAAPPTPAHMTSSSSHAKQKPTIVFVHGAYADASGWTSEVKALTRKGYTVLAPANPLRGLTSDADTVRAFLKTIPGPVVLVGHSYGGAVITNAARGADNVKALVYISAFILDEGESAAQASDPKRFPGGLLGPDTLTLRPVPNAAAPGGTDVDTSITLKDFRRVFAGDQSAATAKIMGIEQRPLSNFAFTEPSGAPAWKTIPSWALVSLQDRAIPTTAEEFMAKRAGARTVFVRSAHDSLVSHPKQVVDLVLRAVRATD